MKVIGFSYTCITIALVIGPITAIQLDVPKDTTTFAELFTSEHGTETYEVTTSDDDSGNSIDRRRDWKDKERIRPGGFFAEFQSETVNNATYHEKGVPLSFEDEPYFVVQPQELGRQKRETPWQRAWRERYERYENRQSRAGGQPRRMATTTPSTTTTSTTTSSSPVHNKFARQFVPNDQDGSGAAAQSNQWDENNVVVDPPQPTDDAVDISTTTEFTTTTTSTTRRLRRNKKITRTTTTTTTTAPADDSSDGSDDSSDDDITPAPLPPTTPTTIAPKDTREIVDHEKEHDPPVLSIQPKSMADDDMHLDPRTSQKLRDLIVQKHDDLRSQVWPAAGNMLKMEWSDEAQRIAQRWAEVCKFEHDDGEARRVTQFKCGQNLARGWPKPLSWSLTMQLWFDERKDFVFDGLPKGMVGHYTQLVWAQSYQIGCAYKDCGSFHYYVCDYCPPGNYNSKKYIPYQKASKFCESCPNNCHNGKLCTNPCPHTDKFSNCGSLDKDFQICSDASYGLQSSCQATCNCKNLIH